jgi:hypothetical protein
VQLALRPGSSGQALVADRSHSAPRRLVAAGVAVVGASLIVANPLAPNVASDAVHRIEHRAVQLTSGLGDVVSDYQDVFATAGANLETLGNEAGAALPNLANQIGINLSNEGGLLTAAAQGVQTGLQNSLFGGWYGGDDGYVFGLFGGSVTHAGVTETGSTLQEIFSSLQQGNAFNAFSYGEEWLLETFDHTLRSGLSPILNTARAGAAPTATLPNQFLNAVTNVTNNLFTYSNLNNLADAVLAPQLSVTFGLFQDLGTIGAQLSTGNIGGALTSTAELPGNLLGNLLNGFVYPGAYNPTGAPFTGLLNSGSILQELLFTWPNQIATALGGSAATATAASGQAAISNGLASISSLIPNLASTLNPSALLGSFGATLGPLMANIAAQLSATLAPNVISSLLLHLPALILGML